MVTREIATVLSVLVVSASGMMNGDDEMAECRLNGSLSGTITLMTMGSGVHFLGTVSNLSPGKHGFHVHQEGDLGNQCTNTGGHYNPDEMDHGSLTSSKRHVGDLENIVAGADKTAKVDKHVDDVDLAEFVGRAIVVHAGEDDLGQGGDQGSITTGNAGGRLDCCVIKMMEGNSARPKTGELMFGIFFGLLSIFV